MSKTTLTDVLRYMRLTSPNQPGRDLGDGELLAHYLVEGDETAFGILVHRHGPMVLSTCRRLLGDWHSAEDAFQATFLVLARRAVRIRKRASVGTWLYGVARRIAVRTKRQAAARRDLERRVETMPRQFCLRAIPIGKSFVPCWTRNSRPAPGKASGSDHPLLFRGPQLRPGR